MIRTVIIILTIFTGAALAEFSYPSKQSPEESKLWQWYLVPEAPIKWNHSLERRLRSIAEKTGKYDSRPTVIIQQISDVPLTICRITTLDGSQVWESSEVYSDPDGALDQAIAKFKLSMK